jgi:hypothetical protein
MADSMAGRTSLAGTPPRSRPRNPLACRVHGRLRSADNRRPDARLDEIASISTSRSSPPGAGVVDEVAEVGVPTGTPDLLPKSGSAESWSDLSHSSPRVDARGTVRICLPR